VESCLWEMTKQQHDSFTGIRGQVTVLKHFNTAVRIKRNVISVYSVNRTAGGPKSQAFVQQVQRVLDTALYERPKVGRRKKRVAPGIEVQRAPSAYSRFFLRCAGLFQ